MHYVSLKALLKRLIYINKKMHNLRTNLQCNYLTCILHKYISSTKMSFYGNKMHAFLLKGLFYFAKMSYV